MYTILLTPLLLTATSALPHHQKRDWQPAPNSVVKCGSTDKVISFFVGPQKESVLEAACVAMMGPCAAAKPEEMCLATIDFALAGERTSRQSVNVENSDGNKISGWEALFTVTPPATAANGEARVQWQKADCIGYFDELVTKQAPAGCYSSMGSGIGSFTVGDHPGMKGTVFDLKIVSRVNGTAGA